MFRADRYETVLNVAQYMVENFKMSIEIVLAIGEDFPDALSVSLIVAKKGIIIMLTPSDKLPDSIKSFIRQNGFTKSYIIGGSDIISDSVISGLPGAERITGSDKYERNIAILNRFSNDINLETVCVATGNDYPDALEGSVLAAKTSSAIILTDTQPKKVSKNFASVSIFRNKVFRVFGGIGVVPMETLENLLPHTLILSRKEPGTAFKQKFGLLRVNRGYSEGHPELSEDMIKSRYILVDLHVIGNKVADYYTQYFPEINSTQNGLKTIGTANGQVRILFIGQSEDELIKK